MPTATALMTMEEFLTLPEKQGVKRELIDGVLIEEETTLSNANSRHETVKANVNCILVVFAAQRQLGKVFPESQFLLDEAACEPDVAFVSKNRLIPGDPDSYKRGAPEIAVEVVSSEKAAALERKIRLYGQAGSQFVWVFYPDGRELRVYEASGNARLYVGDEILEAPGVLPGFQVQVSKFFEGI